MLKEKRLINFFHVNCFREQITKSKDISNKSDELYQRAAKLLNVAERYAGVAS